MAEISQRLSLDIVKMATITLTFQSITIPIAGFLTGIVFMLYISYIYGSRTHNEPTLLKAAASVVTLACLVDLGLSIATLRDYAMGSIENPAYCRRMPKPGVGLPATGVITVFTTQCYFATLVYTATRSSRLWLAVAIVLIACTLAGGIGSIWVFYVMSVDYGPWDPHSPRGSKMIGVCLLGSTSMTIFDLIVTSVLCRILFSSRRQAMFGDTKTMLTYVLATTFQTFLLTTTTGIGVAVMEILALNAPGFLLWIIYSSATPMSSVINRVYAMSLLYTLNRRAPLRARFNQPSTPSAWGRVGKHFVTAHSIDTGVYHLTEFGNAMPASVPVQVDVVYKNEKAEPGSL